MVKIKANLQTLLASKIHTFIFKVSFHSISHALLLSKSALQKATYTELKRIWGGHIRNTLHIPIRLLNALQAQQISSLLFCSILW